MFGERTGCCRALACRFQGSWQQISRAVSAATKAVAANPLSTRSSGSVWRPRMRLIKTQLSAELTYVWCTCGRWCRRQCPFTCDLRLTAPSCRRRTPPVAEVW